jgi:hypothetical protein
LGVFFGSILSFFIPSLLPSLRIDIGYWIMAIIGLSVYTAVIWYSGLMVRGLLVSMEVSKSFYQKLIRKLDFFLIPWTVAALPTLIILAVLLSVPFFLRNMYILFGLVSWSTLIGNGLIIMSISGSIYGSKGTDSQSGGRSTAISLSNSAKEHSVKASVHVNRSPSAPQTPYSKTLQIDRAQCHTILLPTAPSSVTSTPIVSLRSIEPHDSKDITSITPLTQSEISSIILPIHENQVLSTSGIFSTSTTKEEINDDTYSPQSIGREIESNTLNNAVCLDSSQSHELLLGSQSR